MADIDESVLDYCINDTSFEEFGELYRGKVRDVYHLDDRLILVTSDRISAFDHVLAEPIPLKGQVLNELAAFFFEATDDVVPNHLLSVPDPNVMIVRQCKRIPIEFVVRGFLAGHAWRVYRAGGRELCGRKLPDGLKQNSRLPEPILTPATKAESGHDEDISREAILDRGLLDAETFDKLEQMALDLFARGSEMAAERGLLLVDTKYEFGRAPDGTLTLIDEVHTPDSSRYFYADGYQQRQKENKPQKQLSKEFVREWLMDHGFQGKEGQELPHLPDELRLEVTRRYIELYETLTGQEFQPATGGHPVERIRKAVQEAV